MNLVEYARILVRRGWIMLLLAVIAGASAFVFSRQMTPVYRSSQTVLLVPSRSDNGLTLATVQLLENRVAYLQSELVAGRIIDQLNLDLEPSVLRAQTTVTPNRNNLTIQIDVDLPAPDADSGAALINPIAGAWSQALIDYQNELNQEAQSQDRIRAQAQDNPRLSLLRPNLVVNTLIGLVGGIFLGAIVVFVLEYLEAAIVRRRDDIERSASLRVLAVIPVE